MVYYHITYVSNLPSIKSRGLIPSRGSSLGGTSNTGKVFLITKEDLGRLFDTLTADLDLSRKLVLLKATLPKSFARGYWDYDEADFEYITTKVPPKYLSVVLIGSFDDIVSWDLDTLLRRQP